MPEGRMLKKVISESKKLGALKSDSARLFYSWLIPWLDVEHRHSADPEIIKGHVFPKVKSMTIKKIERLLLELHNAKLIILYSYDGENYLQFIKSLQKIDKSREAISNIPPPEKGEIIDTHENSRLNHENSSISKVNESKVNESKEDQEILTHLSRVKNYPFNKEKDLEFIQSLKKEFPSVDVLEKIKQICINWLDFPLLKKSRPRVQIRRWVTNEKKWQKERDQVGKSMEKPTKEQEEFTKAWTTQLKKIQKSHEKEIAQVRKEGDKDKFDKIQNQIKIELADWSREYHKESP